jgi:hypothetical protein
MNLIIQLNLFQFMVQISGTLPIWSTKPVLDSNSFEKNSGREDWTLVRTPSNFRVSEKCPFGSTVRWFDSAKEWAV